MKEDDTMGKFRVATDSGCDLPMSLCVEKGIVPLQLTYEINNVEYTDTMEHSDCKDFYEKMRNGEVPHTSQVNPNQYIEFWGKLFENDNTPVVHIAMGSGISGTYNNGVIAKEMFCEAHPDAEIYLIDSTLASVGYGMLAIAAAQMRDEDKSLEECVSWLEAHKASVNTYYTTGDLTYLYRSGRVSRAGMIIAHTLNIWPILNLDASGHLIVQEKAKGKKKTVARIHSIIKELCIAPEEQTLYICHSDILDEAKKFGEDIKAEFGFKDVYYTYIGSTIGTHSGPGLMAAFFYGKDRT